MRKLLSLAVLMALSLGSAYAQDTMITQSGDILTVYDVEVGGSSVFYKLNATDAASLKMNKSDILMIKYKDGRVEKMDGSATPVASTASTASPQPASSAAFGVNPNLKEDNLKLVRAFNQRGLQLLGKEKSANCAVGLLGIREGSVIETPEVKLRFDMKKKLRQRVSGLLTGNQILDEDHLMDLTERFEYLTGRKELCISVIVENKTDNFIYIDLANCILQVGENSNPFYIPMATTNTSANSSGTSVNMGAITGAIGIGGAVGKLAKGVNVGSGNTNTTSTTIFSQRYVSIPPRATLSIVPQDLGGWTWGFNNILTIKSKVLEPYIPDFLKLGFLKEKDHIYKFDFGNLKTGEQIDIPQNSITAFGIRMTYALDEQFSAMQSMHIDFFLNKVVGARYYGFEVDLSKFNRDQSPLIYPLEGDKISK